MFPVSYQQISETVSNGSMLLDARGVHPVSGAEENVVKLLLVASCGTNRPINFFFIIQKEQQKIRKKKEEWGSQCQRVGSRCRMHGLQIWGGYRRIGIDFFCKQEQVESLLGSSHGRAFRAFCKTEIV